MIFNLLARTGLVNTMWDQQLKKMALIKNVLTVITAANNHTVDKGFLYLQQGVPVEGALPGAVVCRQFDI